MKIAALPEIRTFGRVPETNPLSVSAPRIRGLPFLLASLSAIGPFSVDAYLPSLPDLAHSMEVSELAMQQTLTAYMVPFALMTLWHGAISDALGRRRVILWGLALFAISSGVCALARSLEGLLLFRAIQGLSAGAGMVVGRAVVRDLRDGESAQRLMSHVMMAFALAPAIAPIIGGWLHTWFGWQSIFLFLVVYAFVIWLWVYRALPETLPVAARQPLNPAFLARSYWSVLQSARFLAVCLTFTLNFAGVFIYIVSAPVFLMRHLGVAETGFLWLFGPTTSGLLLGAWASGRLAGRLTPRRTVWCGFGIMLAAAVGNVLLNQLAPPELPWSVVPVFVYSVGMSLAVPTLTLMALDLFPAQRGLASSCQSFVHTSGAAATAALIAPLLWASTLSFAWGSLVLLIGGLLSFVVYLALEARSRPGRYV